MTDGSPYRAAVVKRRPPPATEAPKRKAVRAVAAQPTAEDRAAEIAAEHASRVAAEVTAVRRIESMTQAWNDELSSTVPAVASVVSRAVRSIVGEAPRDEVVMNALRREIARVRGEYRPVLRVSREDGDAWTARLRERASASEPTFDVRPDDALAEGKCLLEIGARRVDITPEAQLDAFDDHLRNGVGAIAPRPAPALPEVAVPTRPLAALQPTTPSDEMTPITVGDAKPVRRTTHRSTGPTRRSIALGKETPATGSSKRAIQSHADSPPSRNAAEAKGPLVIVSRPERTHAGTASTVSASTPEPAQADRGEGTDRTGASPVASVAGPPAAEPTATAPPDAPTRDTTLSPPGPLANVDAADRTNVDDDRTRPAVGANASPSTGADADPSDAAVATVAEDAIDLDALDLGADAARFESSPSAESGGRAPWIGSVVAAPALAEVGIEGGGSRAVAALRERVARTAGDLRREVSGPAAGTGSVADSLATNDERAASGGSSAGRRVIDAGPSADETGRSGDLMESDDAAPTRDAAGTLVTDGPMAERTDGTPGAHAPATDTFPPFAVRARGSETRGAGEPPTDDRTGVSARDDKDAGDEGGTTGGGGDGVRAAMAGARRRDRSERPATDDPTATTDAAGEGSAEAGDRSSRLPPRIAELIAKRRPTR